MYHFTKASSFITLLEFYVFYWFYFKDQDGDIAILKRFKQVIKALRVSNASLHEGPAEADPEKRPVGMKVRPNFLIWGTGHDSRYA